MTIRDTAISRRSFVGASALGAAACALGGLKSVDAARADEAGTGEESYVYTSCPMCNQAVFCGLKGTVVDGKLVRVEGNEFHSKNKPCLKGLTSLQNVYDPNRLLYPVKRTNPKKGIGEDPGWERISWDEALATIAEKFNEAKEKYGPQAVTLNSGDPKEHLPITCRLGAVFGTPLRCPHDKPHQPLVLRCRGPCPLRARRNPPRHGGEMHAVRRPTRGGTRSGVRAQLPHGRARLRRPRRPGRPHLGLHSRDRRRAACGHRHLLRPPHLRAQCRRRREYPHLAKVPAGSAGIGEPAHRPRQPGRHCGGDRRGCRRRRGHRTGHRAGAQQEDGRGGTEGCGRPGSSEGRAARCLASS